MLLCTSSNKMYRSSHLQIFYKVGAAKVVLFKDKLLLNVVDYFGCLLEGNLSEKSIVARLGRSEKSTKNYSLWAQEVN